MVGFNSVQNSGKWLDFSVILSIFLQLKRLSFFSFLQSSVVVFDNSVVILSQDNLIEGFCFQHRNLFLSFIIVFAGRSFDKIIPDKNQHFSKMSQYFICGCIFGEIFSKKSFIHRHISRLSDSHWTSNSTQSTLNNLLLIILPQSILNLCPHLPQNHIFAEMFSRGS